jgi:hypothetical protein
MWGYEEDAFTCQKQILEDLEVLDITADALCFGGYAKMAIARVAGAYEWGVKGDILSGYISSGTDATACSHLIMVYWMLTFEWWIGAIIIRALFTVIMMKFSKESMGEVSHPCKPLCCTKA